MTAPYRPSAFIALSLFTGLQWAHAEGAPPTTSVTQTVMGHAGELALSAGGPGFLAVWEQQAPTAAKEKEIWYALLDAKGAVKRAPAKLMGGLSMVSDKGYPHSLRLFRQDGRWLTVVCASTSENAGEAVWGTVDDKGTYAGVGKYASKPSDENFRCNPGARAGDKIHLAVMGSIDEDGASNNCVTQLIEISADAAKATVLHAANNLCMEAGAPIDGGYISVGPDGGYDGIGAVLIVAPGAPPKKTAFPSMFTGVTQGTDGRPVLLSWHETQWRLIHLDGKAKATSSVPVEGVPGDWVDHFARVGAGFVVSIRKGRDHSLHLLAKDGRVRASWPVDGAMGTGAWAGTADGAARLFVKHAKGRHRGTIEFARFESK